MTITIQYEQVGKSRNSVSKLQPKHVDPPGLEMSGWSFPTFYAPIQVEKFTLTIETE
jgi:hypothetical protein